MLNHVSIGVRDIARTKRFYDAALKSLGYSVLSASDSSLGYGKDNVALWISATDKPVPADDASGLHFCFDAPTRKSVAAFHAAALGAGGARSLQSWLWIPGSPLRGAPESHEQFSPSFAILAFLPVSWQTNGDSHAQSCIDRRARHRPH